MPRLPAGTVTFLFADVEGSTRRVERDAFAAGRALADVLKAIRTVVESNNGVLFETVGDAGYAAFQRPSDAAAAAAGIHDALGAPASAKAAPPRTTAQPARCPELEPRAPYRRRETGLCERRRLCRGVHALGCKDGEARESLRRGLEVIQEHGNVRDLASGLDVAAELALGQGSSERGAILARTAAGLRSEAGLRVPPIEQQRADSTIARTRELLGTAFDRVMSEAQRTPVADVVRAEIALLNTTTVEGRV